MMDDIRRVFDLQRRNKWNLKTSSAEDRRARLRRLRDAIAAHTGELAETLRADLRRPVEGTIPAEARVVLADIDQAIAELEQWMSPVEVEPSPHFAGTKALIQYEARGVVLLFGAWNFPFGLVFQPLVPAIAAGNTAIVMPNELSVATAELTARIIRETFDESEVAVFTGGVELAEALLELPVDHIFFTGSPAVGRRVMAAAARNLASVTLELGGKCPAIVDGTADLASVVPVIGTGKLRNGGQICLSPDHVWVQEDHRDAFVAQYMQWVEQTYYRDGAIDLEALPRIVNERNFLRVTGYLADATARGATLVGTGRSDSATLTVEPAVLLDVPLDAQVMQDEIFGPILPVLTYRDLAEAVEHIQAREKPLAIYVYSTDEATTAEVLARTSSGGVTVNGWATHSAERRLPFGGVNHSGTGAYHGVHGFRELSHARGVVVHLMD
ncbi:aldehyde dehydrogenase family protein [Dactylosporangium sp. AC04546]|uniref:aldehyde dehydrogenase family protein n=1 Tax=Dactylosporangium sp. AC04546 TaxID=2862460 RepID=UPI001EE10A2B|nr:aldehyde dehydrogenase family protein [Dactylosporangium sp. AC04546]WVK86912.1 aldehyde dehydrogenase family protein [Dactylosporangium sp. AC04546]